MNYLYHKVFGNIQGDIIYPLSILKKVYPAIYNEEFKKYTGREYQPEVNIPYSNCKWKDVINLTAVNPLRIIEALKSAGGKPPFRKWYKVPLSVLDKKNLAVFLYRMDILGAGYQSKEANYSKFDEADLPRYQLIPKETIEYYREEISHNRRPLLFHLIPHILYKGEINVKGLEVVETK